LKGVKIVQMELQISTHHLENVSAMGIRATKGAEE